MKNLFVSNLHKKNVNNFTSEIGLMVRRKLDKPFKKLCNIFTNANIIKIGNENLITDEVYFENLDVNRIPNSNYDLKKGKNNIILERYPNLDKDESYIFVCNHTCPEDIETVLNIIDRNAYLVLGSIESLKYNPEMYLTWLNGMIPFDILDKNQRRELMFKMERVIKTNSILIFPEGSHNYHPNKIVNNLFDGPVNLSLKTNKKIVIVSFLKDKENNISYIDVSNPIDLNNINIKKDEFNNEDTAVYYMMIRHLNPIQRNSINDIESFFRKQYIVDAFSHLKWKHDVFDAEYLVKKTNDEKEYEEVINSISNLILNNKMFMKNVIVNKEFILEKINFENKNVSNNMRNYWLNLNNNAENNKTLIKKK